MTIGPAAELAAGVAEHGFHCDAMRLEGRQHVGVEQMHGRDRHLVGVETGRTTGGCSPFTWQALLTLPSSAASSSRLAKRAAEQQGKAK